MEQTNKWTKKQTKNSKQNKNIFWKIDKFLVNIFYIADFTKSILKIIATNYLWLSNQI